MKCKLKEYREHDLHKQKEFADFVGISVSHLSLIENNKRTPSLELAFKIADVFCLQAEDIWVK